MGAAISTRGIAALEAIERLAVAEDLSTQQVIEEIVDRIMGVIQSDAFFAGATDPDTGLCLGAGMAYNLAEGVCHPFWEHEFLIPDYNKFADLTPADPVGDLREATGGRLARSARYRTLNAISDLEDELRATLHAGGRSWGNLQLNRCTGGAPFSEADRAFLRAAAPLAGAALRRALLEEPAHTDPTRGPGVVILDEGGTVISATAEADAWLEELADGWRRYHVNINIHPELLMLSLATLTEADARTRRVRLRTANGTWLVAHASPLAGAGQVALVLEPAKASEIAPIVVEAYGLTSREVEVTRLIARGLSTDEIASTLFLSRHTIRDHLKAIFEKVGVSSRGELTSKLFAEHYHGPLNDAMYASMDRVADRVGAGVAA
ncbi:MAG TPA: helix-turn-helix transcriptional regulator [Solirubrobacteraceae bacterium]|nr:helix-turn-helix transcriptional regulator [Solirubrobacteraceae bacterium]